MTEIFVSDRIHLSASDPRRQPRPRQGLGIGLCSVEEIDSFPSRFKPLRENERSSARRRRACDYESSDRIGMMHANRLDYLRTLRVQVAVNYSNSLAF
jgi:hypothetical protein